MNTALQQQRLEVEQLRREAAMKRIPVSQAVEDIKVKWLAKSRFFFLWIPRKFEMDPWKFVKLCSFWNLFVCIKLRGRRDICETITKLCKVMSKGAEKFVYFAMILCFYNCYK